MHAERDTDYNFIQCPKNTACIISASDINKNLKTFSYMEDGHANLNTTTLKTIIYSKLSYTNPDVGFLREEKNYGQKALYSCV